MGLLQKANEQNSNTPQIRQEKFPEIKEKLHRIRKTINFHPTLFKELIELFSINKGALLVRDGINFTLSSITGYDETTKNRLRLTIDEYSEYQKNNDLTLLQRYFSIREFKTINKVTILPIYNDSKIDGLLLISDFKTESSPLEEELQGYIKELEELWRENPIIRLKEVENQGGDTQLSIKSFVQSIKSAENRVIFLKLDLNIILKKLISKNPNTTLSSMKNTLIKILTSFIKKRGRVFQLSNNQILLALLDRQKNINVTVIQQQITSTFISVFSKEIDSVNLNFENLIWEENSLNTILNHFIPDEVS